MKSNNIHSLITYAIVAFCVLIFLPQVFQQGLFMDGMIYAVVGKNMAEGLGSFWHPYFSATMLPSFHEHPPLALAMQSFFFRLLGDGFYVEKLYSLFTGIATAWVIMLIWKDQVKDKEGNQMYWLPLLIWISIPKTIWSYNSNMLENTMGLFSLISVLFLLKSTKTQGWKVIGILTLAAFFIWMAFLSKGFPGLYPWAFFLCYILVFPSKISFTQVLRRSIILVGMTAFLAWITIVVFDQALESLTAYFDKQVMHSMQSKGRVDSKIKFLFNFLEQALIPLFILLVVSVYKRKKITELIKNNDFNYRLSLFMFFLGLTASLPLLLSPKLSVYYLLPSFPLLSISFAFFLRPLLQKSISKIQLSDRAFKVTRVSTLIIILATIIYATLNFGKCWRDADLLQDEKAIAGVVGPHSTVRVSIKLGKEWSIHAAFQRYHGISLDRLSKKREYMILNAGEKIPEDYAFIDLNLQKLALAKKKDT